MFKNFYRQENETRDRQMKPYERRSNSEHSIEDSERQITQPNRINTLNWVKELITADLFP